MNEDNHGEMDAVGEISADFFGHEPSRVEKIEMRKAVKSPSAWLKLLCKEWVAVNIEICNATDTKFLEYKPYMKGMLSSQLLCRLSTSTPTVRRTTTDGTSSLSRNPDFWETLGILDSFDRCYIIAQIERFCLLYNILGGSLDDTTAIFGADLTNPETNGFIPVVSYMDPSKVLASPPSKRQTTDASRARVIVTESTTESDIAENERRLAMKSEHHRMNQERKDQKSRERESIATQRATERAVRESSREERRRRKQEIRMEREKRVQEEKEAALKRAAELVYSNRVPLEITRGAAAAKAAASVALHAVGISNEPDLEGKKSRSAIVVSTAGDLHRIVTHSKNLWAKYNAIAREHHQKVNWNTVAKELGIHVKVREKYARMHARAEQRGFDWEKNADWKIKDHPEYFLEPPPQDFRPEFQPKPASTLLIQQSNEVTDAAVAAAAAVVDASVNPPPIENVVETTAEQTAVAAAVAATLADPTPTTTYDV